MGNVEFEEYSRFLKPGEEWILVMNVIKRRRRMMEKKRHLRTDKLSHETVYHEILQLKFVSSFYNTTFVGRFK